MSHPANPKGLDVLLGLQWGDEGKGKIVDVLSPHYDIVARFQGGPNAGHTLEFNGQKHVLHLIPSGIFRPETLNVIGNGVIVDPFILQQEIAEIEAGGGQPRHNLLISRKAHLILPTHRLLDAAQEAAKGKDCIGSTLKGIGPAYAEKIARHGLRVGDIFSSDLPQRYARIREYHLSLAANLGFDPQGFLLDRKYSLSEYEARWHEALDQLRGMKLIDSEHFINRSLDQGKRVLAEGAQGTMLDIDFGSYPFVTSSNTTVAGVCSGLGVAPSRIGQVFGIVKAYCTRVGSGPFPTELMDATGQLLRDTGREYGSTTGRPRRCGWLDLPALRYAVMLNGVTRLFLMKTDVLNAFPEISVCTAYSMNGSHSTEIPYDLGTPGLQPVYQQLEGWQQEIHTPKPGESLPDALDRYIRFIEEATGVPVAVVSIGPDREETIVRHNFVDLRA